MSLKKLPTKSISSSKALDPPNPSKPASESAKPPKSDLPSARSVESAERAARPAPRPVAKGKSERRMAREDGRGEEYEGRCEREGIRQVQAPANERRKQKEYEVFVGGLDRNAVEEDLEKVFRKYGEIVEVRLVRRPHSNQNKGFAFVRFMSVEQAKRAADVRFTTVNGKRCEVTRNNDNETLHLRNICTTWTQDQLVEKLKVYDLENLEEVLLMDDPNNKGRNRGFAFLGFSTHNDAVAACTKLQKRSVFFGTDVRAEVAFAKSAVEPDEDIMSQVKSIFIDGLPATWDEEKVRRHFKRYGEIEKVELARNMPTAKRKDFGFISFKTRKDALACIADVNKDGIAEGMENLVLKASLRKPKPLIKRTLPALASRRGSYSGRSHGGRVLRSHEFEHSYSGRSSRAHEFISRDRSSRFSGLDHYAAGEDYSFREDEFRSTSPHIDKYAGLGKEFERIPAPAAIDRRTGDIYLECSSSRRRALEEYREIPASRSRYSSHELYDDDRYSSKYEYYVDYDYPVSLGSKRSYSTIEDDDDGDDDDDDLVVYSSRSMRARRGSDLELDDYAHRSPGGYDEYRRVLPDENSYYNKTKYALEGYRSRYMPESVTSRSVTSRSYY